MKRHTGRPPGRKPGSETPETIVGRNPILETLLAGRRKVRKILVAQGAVEQGALKRLMAEAARRGVPVERVPRTALDRLSDSHQGVAAQVAAYEYVRLDDILDLARSRAEPPFVLILDALQNPQNLGSLLRTAEAVGVHGAVIPLRRGVGITPAVVAASSGACEHILVAAANLAQALARLKAGGVWIAGLARGAGSTRLGQARLGGPLALVVGSEGAGMRRLVREACDVLLEIPMRGRVESLNAAIAGSIGLYAVWQARAFVGAGPTPDVGAVD